MLQGRMQDWPMTVDKILDHAKAWHSDREVVSRSVEGAIERTTYGQMHGRAKRVSNLLAGLGVVAGDRVGTLAWNTARHMEAWYGIMGMGAVCHTLNPRLFAEQLVYIINHAEDRLIFTDLTFLPILAGIRDQIPTVKHIIVLTDADHMTAELPGALCYETLLEQASDEFVWGGFDENSPSGLCYTSGTTGNPKGVLYSHRSNFLHTLVTMGADVMGIGARDTILPVVPMFHANAWGIAFSAPGCGAKLVMPGMKLDGASIHELLESEQVTFSAAVPTVWQMLLNHLRQTNGKLTSLKRVVIGGSAVPEAIVRGFRDEYGVDVTHAWGMTETSPLGTQATPNAAIAAMSQDDQLKFKLKQGRAPLMIDLKLTNDAGERLPHDGTTFGKLSVKGPFVVGEYFRGDGGEILDSEGYFDTGDVATLDEHGFMQITDRSKDVIKSGGEWISSIEIENIAAGHPKAELAAVIGVFHPKWDERPLLLVKLKPGETATKADFLSFLEGKIAKWWTPDDVVFVDDIPLGATGKIDKKLIRLRMADYVLPTGAAVAAPATVALAAAPEPKIYAPEPVANDAKAIVGEVEAESDRPFPVEPETPASDESLDIILSTLPMPEGFDAAAPAILPKLLSARTVAWMHGLLGFAAVVAFAPLAIIILSVLAVKLGVMDGAVGFNLIYGLGAKLALLGVVLGIMGVIAAFLTKFSRFGTWAIAILGVAAASALFFATVRPSAPPTTVEISGDPQAQTSR